MAIRRMFSLQVADTDSFIEMNPEAQTLYFHLALRADDDGFVSGPKRIARMVGAHDKDLEELVAKRFVLAFPSGVVLIKHWHIHNTVRKDRYTKTQWQKEFDQVRIDEATQKYQVIAEHLDDGEPDGNHLATTGQPTVATGKVRKGKVRKGKKTARKRAVKKVVEKPVEQNKEDKDIAELINLFGVHGVNAGNTRWYANTTQREACRLLLKQFGFDTVAQVISILPKTNSKPAYEVPTITTPLQLLEKWELLKTKLAGLKQNGAGKGKGIIL